MRGKAIVLLTALFLLSLVSLSYAAIDRFVSSKTSNVFHTLDCRYAANLTNLNADFFEHYQDAIDRGLTPCQICKPEPEPEEPEVDPNDVLIFETPDPAIIMPTPTLIIHSAWCRQPFDPNSIGRRYMDDDIRPMTLGEVSPYFDNVVVEFANRCFLCGVGKEALEQHVDPQYLTPIYEDPPADPNVLVIVDYDLDPNTPGYVSDASFEWHTHANCDRLNSVKVTLVSKETEVPAVNFGYWNPKKGTLEWSATPFDLGDYIAVGNSDVGQMQFLAVTARPQSSYPTLEQFSQIWLKGNCNMLTYAQWAKQKALFDSYYRGRSSSNGRIEWIFSEGVWKPVVSGHSYNADAIHLDIGEHTTYDKVTTRKEIGIAPYKWATTQVVVTETTTTNYDIEAGDNTFLSIMEAGAPQAAEAILSSVADKVNEPKKATATSNPERYSSSRIAESIAEDREGWIAADEMYRLEIAEEYNLPAPEKVAEPDSEKILATISGIKKLLGDTDMAKEAINDALDGFEKQKEAYSNYLIEYERWKTQADQIVKFREWELEERHMDHMYMDTVMAEDDNYVMALEEMISDSRLSDTQKQTLKEIQTLFQNTENPRVQELQMELDQQRRNSMINAGLSEETIDKLTK